ncbi:uncharacterized protein N7459_004968 [Penicillium hispanicum]|uniref:uncharacterized protein n=1 Tax=Penicillium hispanicum TaxID=1080232 RepID=UPI0025422DD9|nr:uncharacterized protein N7459_004968 [Penicillium hispanicum]KAJ5585168.1 hypothetical protein N7459_004968 [Penicillium hispanicum]
MSVYRLVAPRATRIWSISRPQITRLYVPKSSGLTSGLRNVSPPPIGGAFSLSVPAGKRFTSTIEKPEESEEAGEAEENEQTEAVIPDDPMNSNLVNRFDNKEDRSAAIRTRARGYVIIESEGARNDWPFLIL